MIEWKRVDKNNPPKGKFLFIYDETIFEGWTLIDSEEGLDQRDDEGYPLWGANEGFSGCYEVRWYAEINLPKQEGE